MPDMSMTSNVAYNSVRRNITTATVGGTDINIYEDNGPSMNPRPYVNLYETINPIYDEITT